MRGTLPFGFNNRGQIVGTALVLDDEQLTSPAFVLENGVFTTIEHPDAALSTVVFDIGVTAPFAINNHGRIVGFSFDGVRNHGFLLRDGRYTRITPPGAFIPYVIGTLTTDIDERGRIAGASL